MSVLVVGISHNSAPVALLEQVALDDDGVQKLITDASACEHVVEATVISTCNRVEIYTEVDRFHGSVEELSRLLVDRAGRSTESMLPHLYVHYDDGAVSHLFQVASGLDSMAVGEGQILGQTREALRRGQELGTVGPALNVLFQQALRVGKRSRAETGIDQVAPSLVSAALERSDEAVGAVAGKYVVVVGAGAMAGLATATVSRLGAAEVVVLNRTASRANRLADEYAARPAPMTALSAELGRADVLITCTGATGVLVTRDQLAAARPQQMSQSRPLAVIDVALPHDVDPEVATLPGVTLIGLAQLAEALHDTEAGREVVEVRRIVSQEVTAFLAARRQASVTPTVVALRSMATSVVDAEMARLDGRLPELDESARAEVLHTVRRVADKLLHEPTVRVKELANEQGAVSYATALAELFALDPDAVEAVTRPEGLDTTALSSSAPPLRSSAEQPSGDRGTLHGEDDT
ncbi:MAG: glutamyl-tRNA reductase [Actinomycetota bacterium]|nr:glutamyl-tRNA reductase [Actinomycetota bacterium]